MKQCKEPLASNVLALGTKLLTTFAGGPSLPHHCVSVQSQTFMGFFTSGCRALSFFTSSCILTSGGLWCLLTRAAIHQMRQETLNEKRTALRARKLK